jgi:hypothetical protein
LERDDLLAAEQLKQIISSRAFQKADMTRGMSGWQQDFHQKQDLYRNRTLVLVTVRVTFRA